MPSGSPRWLWGEHWASPPSSAWRGAFCQACFCLPLSLPPPLALHLEFRWPLLVSPALGMWQCLLPTHARVHCPPGVAMAAPLLGSAL